MLGAEVVKGGSAAPDLSRQVSLRRPLCVGINEGLQALEEGGVPPKLLIIDDGWQTTELDASLRPPPSEEEVLRAEQEVRGQEVLCTFTTCD